MYLALVAGSGGARAADGAADELRVEVVGQALSVDVGDMALEHVLEEVAKRAGFEAETRGDLGDVRAQAFDSSWTV